MTVAPPDAAVLEAGFAKALVDAGWTDPTVTVGATASAGANRRTLMIEIDSGGTTTPAVAQLGGIGLNSLSLAVEGRVVALADAAGMAVAAPLASSDTDDAVGAPFLISRRVDGLTVPRHVLRAVAERPELGATLARQCGTALATLHAIDVDEVPEIERLTDPTPILAYRRRLHQLADMAPPSPAIALGLRWLAAHPPEPAPPAIVHGDARNGNLIVDEATGLAAIIDWELAHVGDPMEDLAWLCLRCWRFREDDRVVGGFGDLDDLRDAYVEAGGRWRDDAFRWWQVARTIWWGLALRLQAQAFVAGASTSLVLAASGRRTAELEYDLLVLIEPT